MTHRDATTADGSRATDVLVIGAGMAGLSAAADLRWAGRDVLVVDKGRGVGGRMATRRVGEAVFDHGAQFITAKDPGFAATVARWHDAGVVAEWFRSAGPESAGHTRWRGRPAMTAIAQHLAGDLELKLSCRITTLVRDRSAWIAGLEDGGTIRAEAVVLTAPVPQTLALLDAGDVAVPPSTRTRLESIVYERCLAVMAVLDGPPRIPAPGSLEPPAGPIAWIADNQAKGVSPVPAVTLHADAAYSLAAWESDPQACGGELLQAADAWLGSQVVEVQVHRWRFSKPTTVDAQRCLLLNRTPPLVLAGDAFGGPRVEGAALSGQAAATALRQTRETTE